MSYKVIKSVQSLPQEIMAVEKAYIFRYSGCSTIAMVLGPDSALMSVRITEPNQVQLDEHFLIYDDKETVAKIIRDAHYQVACDIRIVRDDPGNPKMEVLVEDIGAEKILQEYAILEALQEEAARGYRARAREIR